MKAIKKAFVFLPLSTLPIVVDAASQQPLYQIESQLHQLQARYEADSNELYKISALLKQLEQKRRQIKLARKLKHERKQHTAAKTKTHHIYQQQPHSVAAGPRILPVPPSRGSATPRTAAMQATVPAAPAPVAGASAPAVQEASQIVKEAPASHSAQAIYQEQHSSFDNRFSLDTGLTYSYYNQKQLVLNGFLAMDAIFLGNIKVDNVKAQIDTFDLTGRYTINDRTQLDLNVPVLYRSSIFQSGSSDPTEVREATVTMHPKVGDINAGVYYQLMKETPRNPDIVWNLRVKAPTGTNPYGIPLMNVPGSNGNLSIPSQLPSGNGVWTVSTGLSFIKTVDPAILFANINYFHNPAKHFANINPSDTATPGEIALGDSIQDGAGLAFALNDRLSLSLSYLQRITRKSQTRADGDNWTDVVGSDANAVSLNVGTTYAFRDHQSLVFNVGAGLTPDAPNIQLNAKIVSSF